MKMHFIDADICQAFNGEVPFFLRVFLISIRNHDDINLPTKCPIKTVSEQLSRFTFDH